MDLMAIRRSLLMQFGTGGDEIMTITISEATTTTGTSYDAIQSAIGSEHTRWFAWVDDITYWTSGGTKVVAIIGSSYNDSRCIYRNDASNATQAYNNMRRFAYGSAGANIPAGTQFKVIILPES